MNETKKELKDKFLSIGSVIEVKKNQLMICGYNYSKKPIDGKNCDYVCCLYPNGVGKESYLIEKKEIDNVLFLGFRDNKYIELKEEMEAVK